MPGLPEAALASGVAVEICRRLGAVVDAMGIVQRLMLVLVPVLVVMLVLVPMQGTWETLPAMDILDNPTNGSGAIASDRLALDEMPAVPAPP